MNFQQIIIGRFRKIPIKHSFLFHSSDFPEIYSIYAADLQTEKSKFLALTERKGVDSEYLKTEKEDFEFTFNKAIDENKDLVFFLY